MMKSVQIKILTVLGTRPEAIKLFPVLQELALQQAVSSKIVCTAQHREMVDDLFVLFGVRPDHDLNITKVRQTLSDITKRVLQKLAPVLLAEQPDMVLVQGDTTSAFAGALSAFYHDIPVAHVEAGLRSFDKRHPFPEESNRKMIAAIADLHFAPTSASARNLVNEKIPANDVLVTGNTVVDALERIARKKTGTLTKFLPETALQSKKMVLVTAHRRENWGTPLRNLCQALLLLTQKHANIVVVYPVHPNPAVKKTVVSALGQKPRIHLLPPLPYEACVEAMQKAHLIITDSGGIQEEALTFAKPTFVFRKVTERGEGLKTGGVKLVGLSKENVVEQVSDILENPKSYQSMQASYNPYGDGQAARRIVQRILHYFGRAEKPAAFQVTNGRYRRAS